MNFDALKHRVHGTSLEPLEVFLQDAFLGRIRHGDFKRWRERLAALPAVTPSSYAAADVISVGSPEDLDEAGRASLKLRLKEFIPWRKGPFNVFGIDIDTEWRSDMKWNRLKDHISPLAGRTVLDVGCGNGYYGFRMQGAGAKLVIGIDQHIPYVAQFWAVKHFLDQLPVFVLPLSLQAFPAGLQSFDTVFSMGVLYHQRSPIDHLLQLKDSLKPGGELVLETLYVDGGKGYCLMPDEKYARISKVWFLPSTATLEQWLRRCDFEDIKIVDQSTTTVAEQRKTGWMPFDSLTDSLDPADNARTVEGLPAPKRVIVTARSACRTIR